MVAIPKAFAAAAAAVSALNSRSGGGCSLANYKPTFPAGQTTLVAPAEPPKFVGLAFGTQNYTCSSAGTYTSAGALAVVYDASCATSTPQFAGVQNQAYAFYTQPYAPSVPVIVNTLPGFQGAPLLGEHYFVTNPVTGTGISPKWDFTSARFKGNKDAYMIGAVKGNIPAPTNPSQNVPWLDVAHVQGALADEVFRYDTVGGQPPSSCTTAGATLTVKYVAKYALYGGSVA
ncbi:hypothetical protein C8Q80DRAFT_1124486 [Daedaleopsis nitida]|nr:hypothetical protein C8Q80DRAFT_1124486 [Daedaleopsis nitida]